MFDREALFALAELKVAGKVAGEEQFGAYAAKINVLVDGFPEKEGVLKAYLEAKDAPALTEGLSVIHKMLSDIYADRLADDCLGLLGRLRAEGAGSQKTEADLTALLADISMLSIDIQMLRLKRGEGAPLIQPEYIKPAPVATAPAGPPSILAVDDSAFFLNALKNNLHGEPYKLTCLNSGKAALSYISSNRPDLFILDIDMPEMDGYALAKKIKKAGHTAPIVFLTNHAQKTAVTQAIEAGASDFVIKPIVRNVLLTKIKKNLTGKKA